MAVLAIGWGWAPVTDEDPLVTHRDDLELTVAVARGDAIAAEKFVRRAVTTVRRVARAMIADRSEADDAIQLALLELMHATKTYRGVGSLDGWIRRVASRAVLRHARKARTSRLRAAPVDEHTDTREGECKHDTVLESLPRPLEYYLGALPETQRVAMLLRHALGHTIVEIAEITEAPVPTVRSRIKKAQQELRRLIQRDLNLGTANKVRTS
jgi:RNA polymerase sigma-70 factor (ECF subfamily)